MEHIQQTLPSHAGPDRLARLAEAVTLADADRRRHPMSTPFTDEEIGSVPFCTADDVEVAVERAREAQRAWVRRPLEDRAEVLLRYHDLVLDRQNELLDVVQLESGKARRDAFEEVLDVALNCRYYGQNAEQYLRPKRRDGALPLLTRTEEHRHPVGVVGIIAPWNYPLTLAVSDAIPALVAGNAVVLKPAEETPFTALLAVELLREAGLPGDVFHVVTGNGAELGPPLIERIDFLGFTGSTETGRVVARQAGENLVKCSLELGGKNPMLVLDDAKLDRAVEGAVRGCFANAGQLCISFERLYVQAGIYDRFVDEFVRRADGLRLSAKFNLDAEMGSLVSADQLEKVEAHVADAVEKGATVLCGGEARPDVGPYFYEPTVLVGVTDEMLVAREETFGPVVAVRKFEDEGEAVALANDSEYGLNASVWTRDEHRGRRIARRIECGTVNVNDAYAAAWGSVDAPMGGIKQSGLGRRHGAEGILKYTESQTIAEQRLVSIGPPPGVPAEWYARAMTKAMRVLKRVGNWR